MVTVLTHEWSYAETWVPRSPCKYSIGNWLKKRDLSVECSSWASQKGIWMLWMLLKALWVPRKFISFLHYLKKKMSKFTFKEYEMAEVSVHLWKNFKIYLRTWSMKKDYLNTHRPSRFPPNCSLPYQRKHTYFATRMIWKQNSGHSKILLWKMFEIGIDEIGVDRLKWR